MPGPAFDPTSVIQAAAHAVILGTDGDDYLTSGDAASMLLGGDGADTLLGGPGDDLIDGGAGDDIVFGDEGNDVLDGGAGADRLYADGRAGRAGDVDRLTGGPGADIFDFFGPAPGEAAPAAWAGFDTITDFDPAAGDRLEFTLVATSLRFVLHADVLPPDFVVAEGAALEADAPIGTDYHVWTRTQAGVRHVMIDMDHDRRLGTGDLVIAIEGPGAAPGIDVGTLFVGGQAFPRAGGPGDDDASTLPATHGPDTLYGAGGNDTLHGLGGNDALYGDSGDDVLLGDGGADILTGGEGADRLSGGARADLFVLGPAAASGSHAGMDLVPGIDRVMDFSRAEGDRLFLGRAAQDPRQPGYEELQVLVSAVPLPTNFALTLGALLPVPTYEEFQGGHVVLHWLRRDGATWLVADLDGDGTLDATDQVVAVAGDVMRSGPTAQDLVAARFVGRIGSPRDDGPNTLPSTSGEDRLYGLAGNDRLHGAGGDDRLYGGDGADTLDGGSGVDLLDGGAGDDVLLGGEGNDFLRGGVGVDLLRGGTGDDQLSAAAFHERDDPPDEPAMRTERLYGDAGNDLLWGGPGRDALDGGPGADTLRGERGADLLTGGAGMDVFELQAVDAFVSGETRYFTPSTLEDMDTVTDFRRMEGDRIRLGVHFHRSFDLHTAVEVPGFELRVGAMLREPVAPVDDWRDPTYQYWSHRADGCTYLIGDLDFDGILGATDLVVRFAGPDAPAFLELEDVEDIAFFLPSPGYPYPFPWTYRLVRVGSEADDDATTLPFTDFVDILRGGDGNDALTGGGGDDDLSGGPGADVLHGGTGADSLSGDQGADTLDGGDDDDRLHGGAGDDLLQGGAGGDSLEGGDGDDELSGGDGQDDLQGGNGNDRLDGGDGDDLLRGSAGADVFAGGAGADEFRFGLSQGMWEYGSAPQSTLAALHTIADFDASAGDRLFLLPDIHRQLLLRGDVTTPGFTLQAGAFLGGDDVDTRSGFTQMWTFREPGRAYLIVDLDFDRVLDLDDFVLAFKGAAAVQDRRIGDFVDFLWVVTGGTLGDDVRHGTDDVDRIHGGPGDDALFGHDGADVLLGDAGADRLDGGNDDDVLSGGAGADELLGGAGRDRLIGGEGPDLLAGGEDADVFVLDQDDLVFGSVTGLDLVIDFDPAAGDLLVFDTYTPTRVLRGAVESASFSLSIGAELGGEDLGPGFVQLWSVRAGDVTYLISDLDDDRRLGARDMVTAFEGPTAPEVLEAVHFVPGTFTWRAGTPGDDVLVGGDGAQRLHGGDGNDRVTGGMQDDVLRGGRGNDVLEGQDGQDRIEIGRDEGLDAIDGGAGYDTIVALAPNMRIMLSSITNIESIWGGGHRNVSIGGSAGADHLDFTYVSLAGIREIDAGDGNDVIIGSRDADVLNGNLGTDIIRAGDGDDHIRYGRGTDDSIDGGWGLDTLVAIADGASIDWTRVRDVEVVQAWSVMRDMLHGSAGADRLDFTRVLLEGVDRIDGLGGDDEIFGSPRDDVLAGGAGRDELTGGGGRDVFLVDVVAHSTPGRPDVVHDFVAGEDRIDLAGIDADVGIEGRQSFAYVGTSPFSGIAGELRASFVSSGRWLLQGDIDGDQAADVSLMLLGVHAPGPGDILT